MPKTLVEATSGKIPSEYDGEIPNEYYGTKPRGHVKQRLNKAEPRAYSNSKRQVVTQKIDQKFYELMTLVSKWQISDDFLQNTSDPDVESDLKDLHRRLASLSNRFDEIKQRAMF